MTYLIIALIAGGALACFLCHGSDNWRDGEETSKGEDLLESAEDFIANIGGLLIYVGLILLIFWVCSTEIK